MRRPRRFPWTFGARKLNAVRRDRFDYAPRNVDGIMADCREVSSRYWLLGLLAPSLSGPVTQSGLAILVIVVDPGSVTERVPPVRDPLQFGFKLGHVLLAKSIVFG